MLVTLDVLSGALLFVIRGLASSTFAFRVMCRRPSKCVTPSTPRKANTIYPSLCSDDGQALSISPPPVNTQPSKTATMNPSDAPFGSLLLHYTVALLTSITGCYRGKRGTEAKAEAEADYASHDTSCTNLNTRPKTAVEHMPNNSTSSSGKTNQPSVPQLSPINAPVVSLERTCAVDEYTSKADTDMVPKQDY